MIMPKFRYSFVGYDPLIHVKASGRELNVSPKAAREICLFIKGRSVPKAKEYLEDVVLFKRSVPFRRYNKEVAHRRTSEKFHAGRFPVKTANSMIKLLDSLVNNADYKGIDPEKLKIIHAAAHRGRKIPGIIPRAFGRATPKENTLVHIEIIASE